MLEAIGFGIFTPVFFVTSGLLFNPGALLADSAALARVPVFLLALLVTRRLPAFLSRSVLGARRTVAAALLQATSLGFLVVAARIGQDLGLIEAATGAALVTSGLLSVVIFPWAALTLLRAAQPLAEPATPEVPRARSRGRPIGALDP